MMQKHVAVLFHCICISFFFWSWFVTFNFGVIISPWYLQLFLLPKLIILSSLYLHYIYHWLLTANYLCNCHLLGAFQLVFIHFLLLQVCRPWITKMCLLDIDTLFPDSLLIIVNLGCQWNMQIQVFKMVCLALSYH